MKVLIVEDDKASSKLIESIIHSLGWDYESAGDGLLALEKFRSALEMDEEFDLICLDLHVPNFDGVELLSSIKTFEEARGIVGTDGVPVIVITGDEEIHSVFDAMSAGCCSYLLKPLDRSKFIEELRRLGFAT